MKHTGNIGEVFSRLFPPRHKSAVGGREKKRVKKHPRRKISVTKTISIVMFFG
jgi:hypothetical protein